MAQRRYELTNGEWSIIKPLLPNKPRGVPRVDDRRVLMAFSGAFLDYTASRTGAASGAACTMRKRLSAATRR